MPTLDADEFEARLCAMVDYLMMDPTPQKASASVGYSPKYIWSLIRRSLAGDPRLLIRWPIKDEEHRIQFADACLKARYSANIDLNEEPPQPAAQAPTTMPVYAREYVPPPSTDSPLKADLKARLATIRANGPAHPVPLDRNGLRTLPKLGTGSANNDPPEGMGRGEKPVLNADGVPQGRHVGPMIRRDGTPAPGGYSMTTGRPT